MRRRASPIAKRSQQDDEAEVGVTKILILSTPVMSKSIFFVSPNRTSVDKTGAARSMLMSTLYEVDDRWVSGTPRSPRKRLRVRPPLTSNRLWAVPLLLKRC